jgi:hypothetical protein
LGAIIPRSERTWYFKMMGLVEVVDTQVEAFRSLVESITFADTDAEPEWQLPPGWQQEPGSNMRLATLVAESSGVRLETTVIPLATGGAGNSLLDNVNRWRQQMNRPPLAPDELVTETTRLEVAGSEIVLVDVAGRLPESGIPRGPMAAGGGATRPAMSPSREVVTPTYTKPDGWSEAPRDGPGRLAFRVEDGDRSVRVTVTPLGGDGGGVLNVVNLWRREVGLEPLDASDPGDHAQPLEVGGIRGQYVEAIGSETAASRAAVFGWIGMAPDHSWFVKMQGEAARVEQEREAFQAFLHSLKFDP